VSHDALSERTPARICSTITPDTMGTAMPIAVWRVMPASANADSAHSTANARPRRKHDASGTSAPGRSMSAPTRSAAPRSRRLPRPELLLVARQLEERLLERRRASGQLANGHARTKGGITDEVGVRRRDREPVRSLGHRRHTRGEQRGGEQNRVGAAD